MDSSAEEAWGKNIAALSKERRVLAMDLPGFGRSGNPTEIPSLEYYARFVKTFMDSLRIECADLIGHSMGGGIVIGNVLGHLKMARSMTVIDPYGLYEPESVVRHIMDMLPVELDRGSRRGVRWLGVLKRENASEAIEAFKNTFDVRKAALEFIGSEVTVCESSGLPRVRFKTDFLPRMHEIGEYGVRCLFIEGGEDPIFPRSQVRRAAAMVEGSVFYDFRHAGHSPQRESPYEFNMLVASFLKESLRLGRS